VVCLIPREDIPHLARHFVHRFAMRTGKRIETIPAEATAALVRYPWPGNIREIENLIERAVILSPGSTLYVSLGDLKPAALPTEAPSGNGATLADTERSHILSALRETNWVVSGPGGAATRLGLKRSNLQWKMKKLGISRPRPR
jgi:formate hydrogenlyase transcriptional activator